MLLKEKNQLHWLEFKIFQQFPRLKHGIFLKNNALNLSYQVGEPVESVKENEDLICQLLEVPPPYRAELCHSNHVQIVPSQGPCDALVTNKQGESLLITHADCQAALLYDPVHHVLATIHCGWRGNVQNIYAHTILFLQKHFKTRPEDLFVGISPSLGPEHAEFLHFEKEFPLYFQQFQIKPFYFDLWAVSHHQLRELGIPDAHIEIAQECTYSSPDKFYSYRRDKKCGRHGTLAMLL